MLLEKKGHTTKEIISTFFKSIKFLNTLDKGLCFNYALIGIVTGLRPFVNIYMLKKIINALSQGLPKEHLFLLAGISIAINLLLFLCEKFIGHNSYFRMENLTQLRNMEIAKKNTTMDYEFIEDAELQIEMEKMYNMDYNGGFGLFSQLMNIHNLSQNIVLFIIGLILSIPMYTSYAPVLGIPLWIQNSIFTFFIILISVLSIRINKRALEKRDAFMKNNLFEEMRPYSYAVSLAPEYKIGKDIRLYNKKLYNEYFTGSSDFQIKIVNAFLRFSLFPQLAQIFFNMFSLGLIYIFVGIKAYYGAIQIGDIIQYSGAVTQFVFAVAGLTRAYNQIAANCDFFDLCLGYINLKETKYKGSLPIEKRDDNEYEFEFKNVSFKYPQSEKYALKNVNLKFKIGKKLSIVGMNGSGKTTLVKLLTRLYDPSEGEILLNGIDIKKFDYDEYLDIFSVVFQDFNLFALNIAQNVAASADYNKTKVEEALNLSGFSDSLKKMPQGIETYLYNDFEEGGIEISGGEAQKIAMARAIYKDSPFIILDEPTAALDPISEFEIYSKFDTIIGNKTAVYISHRLSSCKFCDEIAVFDEGKLVQHGSHDALLQDKEGKYHELWNAQAQYYKEEEIEKLLR